MMATQILGTCEAILNGFKAGLKLDVMVDLLQKGFAGTVSLKKLGPPALERNFIGMPTVADLCKNLAICLSEAKKMKISLPGAALAAQLYGSLMAKNKGDLGTQALLNVLEEMSNV